MNLYLLCEMLKRFCQRQLLNTNMTKYLQSHVYYNDEFTVQCSNRYLFILKCGQKTTETCLCFKKMQVTVNTNVSCISLLISQS